jgi:hypothetical protein
MDVRSKKRNNGHALPSEKYKNVQQKCSTVCSVDLTDKELNVR